MIGLGAADEPDARSLAAGAVIGADDLEGRIDGFGPGIGEEDVVEARRRNLGNSSRQLECRRMAHLKRRYEVEPLGLRLDGVDNRTLAMAGVDTPQTCHGVENPPPVRRHIMHAFGCHEQARIFLELAVRRERQPERFQRLAAERCRLAKCRIGFIHDAFLPENEL
jgi:hypothetical protein